MKWEILLGSFFTVLGFTEEFLAHSGESRTFSASLEIEATLVALLGLAIFVKAAVNVRPTVRQRKGTFIIVTVLILCASSLNYFAISSVIANATQASDNSVTNDVRPILVRIVGGPISQNGEYYMPDTVSLVIGVNNTIRWQNVDASHHTVTDLNRLFESGNINPNQSYAHSFNKPGVYAYTCDYHPWMKGTVVVKDK